MLVDFFTHGWIMLGEGCRTLEALEGKGVKSYTEKELKKGEIMSRIDRNLMPA